MKTLLKWKKRVAQSSFDTDVFEVLFTMSDVHAYCSLASYFSFFPCLVRQSNLITD